MVRKKCPKCGKAMLIERESEDDEFDDEIADTWGIEWGDAMDFEGENDDPNHPARFCYVSDYYYCPNSFCSDHTYIEEIKRYYYNPIKNNYSAKRPLTRYEAEQKALREERIRQEKAGQKKLFDLSY